MLSREELRRVTGPRSHERGEDYLESRHVLESNLAWKNNDAYAGAVALLPEIKRLMARVGRHDAFTNYLASVRAAHKPKRDFVKLPDRAQWR
jgi:uncharacterized Zn finger protein